MAFSAFKSVLLTDYILAWRVPKHRMGQWLRGQGGSRGQGRLVGSCQSHRALGGLRGVFGGLIPQGLPMSERGVSGEV